MAKPSSGQLSRIYKTRKHGILVDLAFQSSMRTLMFSHTHLTPKSVSCHAELHEQTRELDQGENTSVKLTYLWQEFSYMVSEIQW